MANFTNQANILLKKKIVAECGLQLIWRKPGLLKRVSPTKPVSRVPFSLTNTSLTLKPRHPRWLTAVGSGQTLDPFENTTLVHYVFCLTVKAEKRRPASFASTAVCLSQADCWAALREPLFIAPKFVHMLTHTIQVWKETRPVDTNSLQLQAESRASSHGNADPS